MTRLILLHIALLSAHSAFSENADSQHKAVQAPATPPADAAVPAAVEAQIMATLRSSRKDLSYTNLRPSPVPGIYKIDINKKMAFISATGEYLIAGDMYHIKKGGMVNLQERERKAQEIAFEPERAQQLAALSVDDMVVFTPEQDSKGHVYVFTDIDCGFCRRLHSQIEEFMEKGIEVRYLAFPRAGIQSNSAKKLATVWCSDQSEDLMTRFKQGEDLPLATCDVNPIGEHYMLGQRLGVRGTPAIILSTGKIIPGAVSPEYLAEQMGI
ncbi:MAG: DsbC family protein [Cellvibrionaceae bacterium]|nr:DsbC family protein [Cellvibrionaceae bacterium]